MYSYGVKIGNLALLYIIIHFQTTNYSVYLIYANSIKLFVTL